MPGSHYLPPQLKARILSPRPYPQHSACSCGPCFLWLEERFRQGQAQPRGWGRTPRFHLRILRFLGLTGRVCWQPRQLKAPAGWRGWVCLSPAAGQGRKAELESDKRGSVRPVLRASAVAPRGSARRAWNRTSRRGEHSCSDRIVPQGKFWIQVIGFNICLWSLLWPLSDWLC